MSALALLCALAAMVVFGLAAVLQGVATARAAGTAEAGAAPDGAEPSGGLDPRLLLGLLRQPAFLGSLALNALGFALHITALQTLPLFLVQTVIAGSVAVAAVLSTRVFGTRLQAPQWRAVGLVVLGLALLGPTAASGDARSGAATSPGVLLGAVVVVALLAALAARLPGPAGAVVLGLLAGTGFGVLAVCARLLPSLGAALLTTPTAYVLVLAGATAFLLYSAAMQRGSVTTTTAALVITQTGVPALVGVTLLGDRIRSGLLPLALLGFALALGGAVALGRYERGLARLG